MSFRPFIAVRGVEGSRRFGNFAEPLEVRPVKSFAYRTRSLGVLATVAVCAKVMQKFDIPSGAAGASGETDPAPVYTENADANTPMNQHRDNSDREHRRSQQPPPHGAGRASESPRRPGPHGAPAGSDADHTMDRAAIERAYKRAERSSRKVFQEVKPRRVVAAEAVTGIDGEGDTKKAAPSKVRLMRSPACFIATAAYGDQHAPEVTQLRKFRDDVLLRSRLGAAFVRLYYTVSPPVARLIARRPRLRMATRKVLDVFRAGTA